MRRMTFFLTLLMSVQAVSKVSRSLHRPLHFHHFLMEGV